MCQCIETALEDGRGADQKPVYWVCQDPVNMMEEGSAQMRAKVISLTVGDKT